MKSGPETHVYKTTTHCQIKVDVYRAPQKISLSPVVVWIHGGALINGSRTWYPMDKHHYYHNAGYTVVSIDYRLAPETKLPDILEDVEDAIRWVRQEGPSMFHIDPNRMGVAGHSAGGYLSLMSGLWSPKPQAIVSFYGYGDIIGDWYCKPDPYYCSKERVSKSDAHRMVQGTEHTGERNSGPFYLYCRQNGIWPEEVGGKDPSVDREFFISRCPERQVNKDFPPTLLLHGTADTDVPYYLSSSMAQSLDHAGVPHKMITIPDGPHVFDEDGTKSEVINAMKEVIMFLKQYV